MQQCNGCLSEDPQSWIHVLEKLVMQSTVRVKNEKIFLSFFLASSSGEYRRLAGEVKDCLTR